jgi:hypothetical protein
MKKTRTQPPPPPRLRAWPRLKWSAAAGLAAAVAVTVLVATVRQAALAKAAAQPPGNGQKLSPQFILASDFAVTFVAVTAIVFIAATVAAFRRARRDTRTDGVPAARRGRRAAARGW